MIYQNFDLEIICPQGGNRLCARVLESPQGDCPFIDLKWPFDADTENRLLTDIYGGLRQRHGRSLQATSIQDFGGKLFEAVFSGDIEHLFRSSLDTCFREGKGLRIRLRLPEDSELHMRPWEFLFDTESREFLAVREHTPLVRYLPVAQPIPPITVDGPLRVLVALSSPTDHPRLDIAREWEILCHALEPSISAGRLVLRRVPGHCTFDNLRDSLRHFGAHIFHFVGHGIPGALVLEQESGKGLEMEATHLRSAFPSGALPRLIVLNACSGAITQDVPFSGLAQGFLRQGVPAVVAMQASITDDAAMIFTRYFYRDLVEIGAVDASLTEARLRMQGNGHPIEWGTPVLYMRALSGQLFKPAANPALNPDEPTLPREAPAQPPAPPPRQEPNLYERKKTRDMPARQDALQPQPGAGQVERKKSRVVRVKETAPPLQPAPDPAAHDIPVKVQPKPAAPPPAPAQQELPAPVQAVEPLLPLPPLPPKPDPKPDPKPAAPAIPPKAQPPEYASHSRPVSYPGAQGSAPTVQPEESALPPRPEPKPAEIIIPPRVASKAGTPPVNPEPKPAGANMAAQAQAKPILPLTPEPKPAAQEILPKAEPKAGTPPARPDLPPARQHSTSQAEAEEFTVPLPREPKPAAPHIAPKTEAPQHAPAPKREPELDEEKTVWNIQPRALTPVFTLEPDPELAQQGILAEAGRPTHGPPAPPREATHPLRTRRVLVAGSAGGLLALALAVGIGVNKNAPPTDGPSTAPPPPPVITPATPPVTMAGPTPAADSNATAAAAPMPTATPPPAMAGSGEGRIPDSASENMAGSGAQAKGVHAKAKPVAANTRRGPSARKPVPPVRTDNCRSGSASEKKASCVFKK